MADENQIITWIIAGAGAIGGLIARDRQVMKKIADGDGKTHDRIDKIKDDLNENFARKSDVQLNLERIESKLDRLIERARQGD